MIQWYPGHMHKAKKEYLKILPQTDLVIEVLDARIPFSSQNPLLTQLRKDKPCIKLLNKSDLADKAMVSVWQEQLEHQTILLFSHYDWQDSDSFLAHCSTKWGYS